MRPKLQEALDKHMQKQAAEEPKQEGAAEFLSRLFEARDYLHFAHLKVSGDGAYAAHKALNEAYDGILGLADGLVESYQGVHGLVDLKTKSISYNGGHLEYIKTLYKYIDENRSVFKESFLQNQVDTVEELLASTIYKLENLK